MSKLLGSFGVKVCSLSLSLCPILSVCLYLFLSLGHVHAAVFGNFLVHTERLKELSDP